MNAFEQGECEQSEALRDYAFDELSAAERVAMERHVAACAKCGAELQAIRMTTATLRSIPDREIPQRIAFVSDKLFEPSPMARFFHGLFTSPSRLGFAAACLLAAAIVFSAVQRPAEVRTVVATANAQDVAPLIEAAVQKAVAQIRAGDARVAKTALAAAEVQHRREHSALMVTMQENLDVMQKRMGAYTSLASLETTVGGGGQ